MIVCFEK